VLKAQHHRGREVTRTPQGSYSYFYFLLQKAAMPQPNSILLSERFGRTVGLAAKVSSCDPVEFLAARRTDNQIGLPRDDLLDGRYSAEEPMVCATLC
jgi:hypothetical protein